MRTTIVIPTYNEAVNIGELVRRIRVAVPEVHIVVVDDNSPDGTGKLVQDIAQSDGQVSLFARPGKEGLGLAYVAGFKKVLTDSSITHVVMMDSDLSHDPAVLPAMLKAAESFELVVGSRYVKGGGTVGWELWRRALSFWGNFYARVVAGLPIHDCTGGFNCINANNLRSLDLGSINATGYAFIMGLKFRLIKNGASVTEVPIVFRNRTGGESKMSSKVIARYFNEGILAPWKMRFKRVTRA